MIFFIHKGINIKLLLTSINLRPSKIMKGFENHLNKVTFCPLFMKPNFMGVKILP